MSSLQLHVIDQDVSRRAEISYILADSGMNVQVYEGLHELMSFRPRDGVILLNDDGAAIKPRELSQCLADLGTALPIAMYAQKPEASNIVEAVLSGALDYLTWPFDPSHLERSLSRILERSDGAIQAEREKIEARARVSSLTPRETEVLQLVTLGRNNKEIAKKLSISPRTVEIHRANIILKLNVRSTVAAVRVGIYAGLDQD